MASFTAETLHIPAEDTGRAGAFAALDAKRAGWETLNFAAVRLGKSRTFEIAIDAFEYVAVVLSGRCNIRTNRGDFENVGRRDNVFCGMPHALYLPPQTEFEIEAITDDFEFASCWAPTEKEHPPKLIKPNEAELLLLGGGNCSRQMNRLIGGDFTADRLLVYELYTPGGTGRAIRRTSTIRTEPMTKGMCWKRSSIASVFTSSTGRPVTPTSASIARTSDRMSQ